MLKNIYQVVIVFVCACMITIIYNVFYYPMENEKHLKDNHLRVNADLKDIRESKDTSEIPVFTYDSLSNENIIRITDSSWNEDAPVKLSELSYLEVTYIGFDNKDHVGELIVNKQLAYEVLEIFKELYDKKFPIDKIKLIDEYAASDILSMSDNNTCAFNYRKIEGSNKISNHSYGIAIDINPIQNPYINNNKVSPIEGKEFMDRNDKRVGMIKKGDSCYDAFKKRGWDWGGEWKTVKDYQHFEKKVK